MRIQILFFVKVDALKSASGKALKLPIACNFFSGAAACACFSKTKRRCRWRLQKKSGAGKRALFQAPLAHLCELD